MSAWTLFAGFEGGETFEAVAGVGIDIIEFAEAIHRF
jgi:hypothetical protein